jgi:acetyl esterase/lipase
LKHTNAKKRPTIIIGLILLLLTACSNPGLLVANSLAQLGDYTVVENIAYGKQPLNRLSIYLPEPKHKNPATIIFFYGGCWGGCETLNKEHYLFVAQALTANGFNVVIPDYRRHPEVKFASIMDDATRTVEWVKTHIDVYGGDPNKLFLMGHSAGAHIAAMLTFNEKYLSPETYRHIKGFIGMAGPYDFLPFTDDYQKIVFSPVQNYPNTQPVNFVDGTEPPLLLLYGNDDDIVKPINIESLTRTVKQKGGCVEPHRYDSLDHTGLLGTLSIPLQGQEKVLDDILRFVNLYADGQQCLSSLYQ